MTLVLIGKSGSGKSTVAKLLEKEYGLRRIVTFTTRPIREGERDGVDYRFVNKKTFDVFKKAGFFAETADYKTEKGIWSYGSAKLDYEEEAGPGVIVLTPAGVKAIKKAGVKCVCIYLRAKDETLMIRLANRGDDIAEMLRRLRHDDEDFEGAEELADLTINVDSLEAKKIAAEVMGYAAERKCM